MNTIKDVVIYTHKCIHVGDFYVCDFDVCIKGKLLETVYRANISLIDRQKHNSHIYYSRFTRALYIRISCKYIYIKKRKSDKVISEVEVFYSQARCVWLACHFVK